MVPFCSSFRQTTAPPVLRKYTLPSWREFILGSRDKAHPELSIAVGLTGGNFRLLPIVLGASLYSTRQARSAELPNAALQ